MNNHTSQWKITDVNVPFFALLTWLFKWFGALLVIMLLHVGILIAAFKLLGAEIRFPRFDEPQKQVPTVPPFNVPKR